MMDTPKNIKTCARCSRIRVNDTYGTLCEDCYVDTTSGFGSHVPAKRLDGGGQYRHSNKTDWKKEGDGTGTGKT